MRAAAILGPGSSPQVIKRFRSRSGVTWSTGIPANATEADIILIFGGDGTIHRYLPQLVALQLPVLIVPCGSGNDFARALKLRSVRDAQRAWNNFGDDECVRAIDIGVIKELDHKSSPNAAQLRHYFCCVACVGLDATVARRANALPRWIRAHGGYALSLPFALWSFKSFAAKFTALYEGAAPKDLSSEKMVLAAFANAPAYGHGVKIAPRAELGDGQLDVCVVSDIGKIRLLSVFPSVYFGRHLSLPQVNYSTIENLRMETERPMDVYADGEYVCRTPIEVSVVKESLRVVVSRL
ncbi:MAG: hypothetical protein QOD84_1500 [Acidobacteriaceae bacterium]